MARRLVNVTFEIDSDTRQTAIIRRKQVPSAGASPSREVIERYPLGFLMPKKQAPREDVETLYHILRNILGNPV